MKEIKLSQFGKNKGKYVALVDDEDFEYLNQFKWHALESPKTVYAVRQIRVDGKQNKVWMHGAIMSGKWIDHIDHNGLNNQKSNLRFCTSSENCRNRQKRVNCTSIYKGIHFNKSVGKWQAQIMVSGKHINLGHFASEADAAAKYNDKAKEMFGAFANPNTLT